MFSPPMIIKMNNATGQSDETKNETHGRNKDVSRNRKNYSRVHF